MLLKAYATQSAGVESTIYKSSLLLITSIGSLKLRATDLADITSLGATTITFPYLLKSAFNLLMPKALYPSSLVRRIFIL